MNGTAFKIARFRFRLGVRSPIELPQGFKGSTFHGAFGHALNSLSPHFYELFFNPTLPAAGKSPSQLPKPFVLVPPLDERPRFEAGEEFHFELVLFGRAVSQLPVCIAAIDHLGKNLGLGINKGRFAIKSIDAIQPSGESLPVLNERGAITWIPESGLDDFIPPPHPS